MGKLFVASMILIVLLVVLGYATLYIRGTTRAQKEIKREYRIPNK